MRRLAFRPDIEGVRAVAVLAVVLNHAGVPGFGAGFIGVDLFFVVSGFLITEILVRDTARYQRVRILEFYARRARRILPAAAIVLLSCLVAGYAIAGSSRGNVIAADVVWAGLFGANWRFINVGNDYFAQGAPTSPIQHFWSLGVEEQFYLVWPLLLTVAVALPWLRRRQGASVGILVAASCVASFAFCVWQTSAEPLEAYFSPFTRAWELGVGAAVAVIVSFRPRLLRRIGPGWAGVGAALVLAAMVGISPTAPYPGYLAVVPVVGVALVIAAGSAPRSRDVSGLPSGVVILVALSRLVQNGLRSKPLQYVGRLSYGFYLWHLPILQFAYLYFGSEPSLGIRLCLVVAALALADLTYVLIEAPLRHSRFLRSRAFLSVGLGTVIVGCVAATALGAQALHRVSLTAATEAVPAANAEVVHRAVASAVTQPASTDLTDAVDRSQVLWNPAWWGTCVTADTQIDPAGCVLGDVHGARTWVLFGDSHVQMLFHPMNDLARRSHARLVVYTKAACGPYAGVRIWDTTRNRPYQECDAFNAAALARIARMRPEIVIISGLPKAIAGRQGPEWFPAADLEPVWSAGEKRTIAAVRAAGARVVVVGDIAEAPSDPSTCLRAHLNAPQNCAGAEAKVVFASHNEAEAVAARQSGATYVPMTDLMCAQGICPAVIAGRVVYRDQWHLSASYALYLVEVLAQRGGLR